MKIQFSSTIPVTPTLELGEELSELVSWTCNPLEYTLVRLELEEESGNGFAYTAWMEKQK